VQSKLSPARFISVNPDTEARCCFCYGLIEDAYCLLGNQEQIHKDCLPSLLKAQEQPDLDLHLPDGQIEKVKGYQQAHPWSH
jgi:hypothetical protein